MVGVASAMPPAVPAFRIERRLSDLRIRVILSSQKGSNTTIGAVYVELNRAGSGREQGKKIRLYHIAAMQM
jgi:hypothetical protein